MTPIKQIKKRDGRIVKFNQDKITDAIWKAAQSVGGKDRKLAEKISNQVTGVLDVFCKDPKMVPTVEQIQDLVEKILIEDGHAKTAKAYILYRQKHQELREQKAELLGIESETKFSLNAIKILEQRYLLKDEKGQIIETPEQMIRRVAHNIAQADKNSKGFNPKESEETFYQMMIRLDFLPNTPTLMNAGTNLQQLAGCFVLPVEDSIESIFETLRKTAIIQQTGGGTGFNFSKLRPRGDIISSTKGASSGPVSFIKVFDAASSTIKEGGKRRGANMAIVNVDHPDILEFIGSKEKEGQISNFNISVGLTSSFMDAVEHDEDYDLTNPRTGNVVNRLHARSVFELIVARAWSNGEPGIVFLDRIEGSNPTPKVGELYATNPCGEQPLLPYEACNLGSINISHFVQEKSLDWERLKKTVQDAIHLLDNVIDMSDYKFPEISKIVLGNRKVGLGIMGFADLLFRLKISYNSEASVHLADELMSFIEKEAKAASEVLGKKKGSFPNFHKSVYPSQGYKFMRNATVTTVAPAGTIGMIAEATSGIEPLYALVYTKHVLDGTELLYVNRYFEKDMKKAGLYSKELMRTISKVGSIQNIPEIPEEFKKIYVIASDISPQWHIQVQAVFQKNTDNAVSKTINFPANASLEDVKKAYLLAYQLGCKGVTVYRDLSRKEQVLVHGGNLELQSPKPKKQSEQQISIPFEEHTKKTSSKKRPDRKAEEVIPPPVNG